MKLVADIIFVGCQDRWSVVGCDGLRCCYCSGCFV